LENNLKAQKVSKSNAHRHVLATTPTKAATKDEKIVFIVAQIDE